MQTLPRWYADQFLVRITRDPAIRGPEKRPFFRTDPPPLGYARVSTKEQSFDLQVDALRKSGCEKIHQEVVSGAKAERPVLNALLRDLRPGDVLVSWKLDRLGRSLRHLVELAGTLMEQHVGLKSLNDPIDTTTPQDRLTFNLFASLAEYAEPGIMQSRTAKVDVLQAF